MTTNLPAQWVEAGYVPAVCSRHGQAATRRVAARFASRPAPWAYLLIVVSFLIYAIVVWATGKTVVARGWPFCTRCRIIRVLRFLAGLAVFATGVGAIVLAQPPASTSTQLSLTAGLILATGLVLFLAGIIAMTRSGWASVARAAVTRDGIWVSVRGAHQEFDAQVLAATSRAQRPAHAGSDPGASEARYVGHGV
jgi:hypothetical protein